MRHERAAVRALARYAIAFSKPRRGRKPIYDSAQVKVGSRSKSSSAKAASKPRFRSHTLGVESMWPVGDEG
jgi:hypothetical protein